MSDQNTNNTELLIPPEDWAKPTELHTDHGVALDGIASMIDSLKDFAEPTLRAAMLQALTPDTEHTDPASCAWCTKRAGTPEKPSTYSVYGGVPLCYDCRDRAALTFIRLLKTAIYSD